jgi:hypothetical protein
MSQNIRAIFPVIVIHSRAVISGMLVLTYRGSGNHEEEHGMSEPTNEVMWRRSSRCGSGACVEMSSDSEVVYLRDAKDPSGPQLTFSHETWRAWIAGLKDDDVDTASRVS